MPSFFIKLLLICSAISPTLFVWAIIILTQENFVCNKHLISGFIILIILTLLFILIPPLLIKEIKRRLSISTVEFISIKLLDSSGEGFIGVYLIPFLASAITNVSYFIMVAVLVVLCFSMWMNNAYSFNPILALFKYRFYEVFNSKNAGLILLSKRRINDPSLIKKAIKITDNLYLDKE